MLRIAATCLILFLATWFIAHLPFSQKTSGVPPPAGEDAWVAPDTLLIALSPDASMISYGRDLIAHTDRYYGPHGSLGQSANGMNCQNCHLDAGTRPWGNNFGAVFSTYPRFRERRGSIETICERVNDCFQRSLNGRPLDTAGLEMRAMLAYMQWLGRKVPKGRKPAGSGIRSLAFMARAADPEKGKAIYQKRCVACHGPEGQGQIQSPTGLYAYPPLWGEHSYNTAAGLYRLSRFASFIKDNMPYGSTHGNPLLTEAEAWDVAAYINARPRPDKKFSMDWPDIRLKPLDHPFGPYSDTFSEKWHKYGPFDRIQQARQNVQNKNKKGPL